MKLFPLLCAPAAAFLFLISCSDSTSSSEDSSNSNSSGTALSEGSNSSAGNDGTSSSSLPPGALADTSTTGTFAVFANCGDREAVLPNDQQRITLGCSLKHPPVMGKSATVKIETSDTGKPTGWNYTLSVDNQRYTSGSEVTVNMTVSPTLDLTVSSVSPDAAQIEITLKVIDVNNDDNTLTIPFRVKRVAD